MQVNNTVSSHTCQNGHYQTKQAVVKCWQGYIERECVYTVVGIQIGAAIMEN